MVDTLIEKLVGKKGSTSSGRPLIEDLMEQQARAQAQKVQELQIRKMELEGKKDVLQLEKEVARMSGSGGDAPKLNVDAQLLNDLVKQGMDIQKATDMIQKMDPLTRARTHAIYAQSGGADQLGAWMLLSNQSQTPADQAVGMLNTILDAVEKRSKAPQGPPPMGISDVMNLFDRMKPGQEQQEQIQYLADRQEKLQQQLEAEREQRHQQELRHAEEMAALRQANVENQLKEINGKLEAVQSGKNNNDPLEQFGKTVDRLKGIGLPIAIGAAEVGVKTPIQEANDLVKTVMESPGMDKVFTAAGDRIREGGFSRRGGGQSPQVRPGPVSGLGPGEQILCDNCLAQGKKTPLPITPGVVAGTEGVTCPVCKTTYRKGASGPGPQPPPGGGSGGQPPGPSTYFPGRF